MAMNKKFKPSEIFMRFLDLCKSEFWHILISEDKEPLDKLEKLINEKLNVRIFSETIKKLKPKQKIFGFRLNEEKIWRDSYDLGIDMVEKDTQHEINRDYLPNYDKNRIEKEVCIYKYLRAKDEAISLHAFIKGCEDSLLYLKETYINTLEEKLRKADIEKNHLKIQINLLEEEMAKLRTSVNPAYLKQLENRIKNMNESLVLKDKLIDELRSEKEDLLSKNRFLEEKINSFQREMEEKHVQLKETINKLMMKEEKLKKLEDEKNRRMFELSESFKDLQRKLEMLESRNFISPLASLLNIRIFQNIGMEELAFRILDGLHKIVDEEINLLGEADLRKPIKYNDVLSSIIKRCAEKVEQKVYINAIRAINEAEEWVQGLKAYYWEIFLPYIAFSKLLVENNDAALCEAAKLIVNPFREIFKHSARVLKRSNIKLDIAPMSIAKNIEESIEELYIKNEEEMLKSFENHIHNLRKRMNVDFFEKWLDYIKELFRENTQPSTIAANAIIRITESLMNKEDVQKLMQIGGRYAY